MTDIDHIEQHADLWLVATVNDDMEMVAIHDHHLASEQEARSRLDVGHIKHGNDEGRSPYPEPSEFRYRIGTHLLLQHYDTSQVNTTWFDGEPAPSSKVPTDDSDGWLRKVREAISGAEGFGLVHWGDDGLRSMASHGMTCNHNYLVVPASDDVEIEVGADGRVFRQDGEVIGELDEHYTRTFQTKHAAERFRATLEKPGAWATLSTLAFSQTPDAEVLRPAKAPDAVDEVMGRWFGGAA